MARFRSLFSCLAALAAMAGAAGAQDDAVLVINRSGVATEALIPNLDTPRGTALDQDNGLFFVSVTGGLGSTDGFVLRLDLNTGEATPFVTGVSPFDLEIDPVSGDLFISDASNGGGVLRTPTGVADVSTFASGFVPSGLGFAPNGSLFAGAQPSSPNLDPAAAAGLFEITPGGVATQVGLLDQPFDVQVDSQGNVFVNNGIDFPNDGEIAVFAGLGAGDNSGLGAPLTSATFSDTAIRGLAIGPNDEVFATTSAFTIVEFEPLADLATIDPTTNLGAVFAGPPIGDIGNPFAFDIQFLPGGDFQVLLSSDDAPASLVPEPAGLSLLALGGVAAALRRRRPR